MSSKVLRSRQEFVGALLSSARESGMSTFDAPPRDAEDRYRASREPFEEALKASGDEALWRHYVRFEGDAYDFAMDCLSHGIRRGALAEEMRRHLVEFEERETQ